MDNVTEKKKKHVKKNTERDRERERERERERHTFARLSFPSPRTHAETSHFCVSLAGNKEIIERAKQEIFCSIY